MKIGILQSDLNAAIGGGQTFFRSVIRSSAHSFLFPSHDTATPSLHNCRALPIVNHWQRYCHTLDFGQVTIPNGKSFDGRQSDIMHHMDMVQSFEGQALDVLEIPDYLPYAAFVPDMCRHLGVKVGKFVLSMHGTLSMALEDNWAKFDGDLDTLKYFEALLFRRADIRYGIGKRYIEATGRRFGHHAHLLDAGTLFHLPRLAAAHASNSGEAGERPDLIFIGRHEKWKGPDVFIDLVSKLPRESFGKVRMIGPEIDLNGTKSGAFLKKMASWRGLDISFEVLDRETLMTQLQTQRAIAIFPSRLDTFNLSALEALSNGCPSVIGSPCGVIDYLEQALPGLPFVTIGENAASDRMKVLDALDNYDTAREKLVGYLQTPEYAPFGATIDDIYAAPSQSDAKAVALLAACFKQISDQFPRLYSVAKWDSAVTLERSLQEILAQPPRSRPSSFLPDCGLLGPAHGKRANAGLDQNPLFDAVFYLDAYHDVRDSGRDPYRHYVDHGAFEGRKPNAVFDGAWYLAQNGDVAASGANPLDHYMLHGAAEGRHPAPYFDGPKYAHDHALAADENPLLHFLKSGAPLPGGASSLVERPGAIRLGELMALYRASVALADDIDTMEAADTVDPRLFAEKSGEVLQALNRHNFSGDRVEAYRLASELEHQRGNDVLCATYNLRRLRLGGVPDPACAERTAQLLEANNYAREAEAARLLYGGGTPQQIADYLAAQDQSLRSWSASPEEEIIERRAIAQPRVSIIVSVYNGVSKLGTFFETLQSLTPKSRQTVELVIVDSASRDGTGDWMTSEIAARSMLPAWLSIVYARSAQRETIQKAWNRGILLAKGRYFAFMGIDECNRPDAYDKLADYLDAHPAIDWVVSDAVVQDVDMGGTYVNDIMVYRRAFESKNDHLLECCYMSYVGCLYRADIHAKLGFYDDSFRAAGDTEFKNRILRGANFGHLDDCLGFFTNYPEERMTQSPLAEIEDLRAWYLHRSLGGLMCRFQDSPADEVIALFIRALDYKKSYMDRRCTDLELASTLAELVAAKFPAHYQRIAAAADAVAVALDAYRMLDGLTVGLHAEPLKRLAQIRQRIEQAASQLIESYDRLVFLGKEISLDFVSDNRSHQHNTMWPSEPKRMLALQASP